MKLFKWTIILGVIFVFASCGYHFEGGGFIDEDIQSISVKVLNNRSSESGIEVVFTNALIKQILQVTDTKVTKADQSTSILEGTVNAITFQTLSRSTTESVVERRITVILDLQIIDNSGNTLWSVKDFSTTEDYTVSADNVTDENNKRIAVNEIATKAAEKLVGKMLNTF